jgi:hypothetical protein
MQPISRGKRKMGERKDFKLTITSDHVETLINYFERNDLVATSNERMLRKFILECLYEFAADEMEQILEEERIRNEKYEQMKNYRELLEQERIRRSEGTKKAWALRKAREQENVANGS